MRKIDYAKAYPYLSEYELQRLEQAASEVERSFKSIMESSKGYDDPILSLMGSAGLDGQIHILGEGTDTQYFTLSTMVSEPSDRDCLLLGSYKGYSGYVLFTFGGTILAVASTTDAAKWQRATKTQDVLLHPGRYTQEDYRVAMMIWLHEQVRLGRIE